jgi:hypothetical protein
LLVRERRRTQNDRRSHPRYNVGFGAEVFTARGIVAAGTRDVSRGGCQLAAGRALDEGAVVRIELCLIVDGIQEPEVPRLTVTGRIQWTAESEDETGPVHLAGVRFQDMTEQQGDWLEHVLVQHGVLADATDDLVIDVG